MSPSKAEESIHLVLFTEEFYPSTSGGAHTRWLFAKQAAERGNRVTVFTMRDPGTPRSEIVDDVEIIRPVSGSPESLPAYSNFSLPFRLGAAFIIFLYSLIWIRTNNIDVIQSTSHSFHWASKVLSIVYQIPLTSFVGCSPSVRNDESRSLRQRLERINLRYFMGEIVYCRHPVIQTTAQSMGNSDVRILHGVLNTEKIREANNLDVKYIRRKYDVAQDESLIAFVGRLVPIKQPKMAIEILEKLPKKYRLLMVGDGPKYDEIKKEIERRGLGARIQLAGQLPHVDTLGVIRASDIILLTSETESYGAVAFEGLALGSNVVTPPIGIFPSLDIDRLHIVGTEGYPNCIQQIQDGSYALREEILEKYSIRRYTADVITDAKELAE